jgi:hypothetical protein
MASRQEKCLCQFERVDLAKKVRVSVDWGLTLCIHAYPSPCRLAFCSGVVKFWTLGLNMPTKHSMPAFLEGNVKPAAYERWLHRKAAAHLKRDRKRGRTCAQVPPIEKPSMPQSCYLAVEMLTQANRCAGISLARTKTKTRRKGGTPIRQASRFYLLSITSQRKPMKQAFASAAGEPMMRRTIYL